MRLFPCNSHTLSEITGFHSMWFLQDTSSPYQGKRNYHRAYKNLPALQMIRTLQFTNCTFPIMHLVCTFCVIIVPREIEDKGCVKFWGKGGGGGGKQGVLWEMFRWRIRFRCLILFIYSKCSRMVSHLSLSKFAAYSGPLYVQSHIKNHK